MKRKPDSGRDLLLVVANVEHPLVKYYHQKVLDVLGTCGDWATGRNCRPTYALLQTCLKSRNGKPTSDTWVGNVLAELIQFGLIERTYKGHGLSNGGGLASEFRLCLENSAYPDTYPTYKAKRAVSAKEPILTPSKQPLNPNQTDSLPKVNDVLTPSAQLEPSFDSHPKHTPTHTSDPEAQECGVCVDTKDKSAAMVKQNPAERAVSTLLYEATAINPPSAKSRLWMVSKADEVFCGTGSIDKFLGAGRAFLKAKDWDKFRTETTSPWLMFENGYPKYMGLRDELDGAPAREREKAEEYKRSSELAREAHMKLWGQNDEPGAEASTGGAGLVMQGIGTAPTVDLSDEECEELFGKEPSQATESIELKEVAK